MPPLYQDDTIIINAISTYIISKQYKNIIMFLLYGYNDLHNFPIYCKKIKLCNQSYGLSINNLPYSCMYVSFNNMLYKLNNIVNYTDKKPYKCKIVKTLHHK